MATTSTQPVRVVVVPVTRQQFEIVVHGTPYPRVSVWGCRAAAEERAQEIRQEVADRLCDEAHRELAYRTGW